MPEARALQPAARSRALSRGRRWGAALGIYGILVLLLVLGRLVSADFLTVGNLLNILRPVTLLGIVALGVMFITVSGHYVDLSIPGTMALCGMVTVGVLEGHGLGVSLACGLGAGLVVGLVNGLLVGILRLNPIIWTLAMNFLLDGLLRWWTGGTQVYPDYGTPDGAAFVDLARWQWGPVPGMSLLWVALAAVAAWGMRRTTFGRALQLTGAAYDVAATTAVPVGRVVCLAFVLSSLATAVAGILLAALSKQGTFTNGVGYDFNAITAVVVGGVSLAGGRGSVAGVLSGVIVIGLLGNIMTLAGWGTFDQMMARGVVFVVVVAATELLSRRGGRVDG